VVKIVSNSDCILYPWRNFLVFAAAVVVVVVVFVGTAVGGGRGP